MGGSRSTLQNFVRYGAIVIVILRPRPLPTFVRTPYVHRIQKVPFDFFDLLHCRSFSEHYTPFIILVIMLYATPRLCL
ncbi:hypothetical protein LCGC14_1550950 [marine sediment metagenome]|uniref:Uncharacterized protein n=1 Tax=marine sediment metagenome TaxID=412755 RepID=A0A0F9IQ86_9ZZZZ